MGVLVTSMTEKDARVVSDFFTLAPKGEIPKAEVRRILTTLGYYPTLGPSHVAKLLIESGAAEIVQGDLGHEFVLKLVDRVLPGPVDPMAVQLQCKYCSETFQDKIQLMRHTRAAKHAFPVDRLKEILAGPQKTYDEIARELGLPHSTVSRWISVLKAQGAKGKHEEPQEPGSRTPKSGGVNPGPREEVKTRVDQLEAEGCHNTLKLEYHHTKQTGLSGEGRGRNNRILDIMRNPDSYALLCVLHHAEAHSGQRVYRSLAKRANKWYPRKYYVLNSRFSYEREGTQ